MHVTPAQKDWTFLSYNPSHTNTGHTATQHLLELEQVGSDAHVDLACLNYREPWLAESLRKPDPASMGTHTYHLEKATRPLPSPGWLPAAYRPVAEYLTATPDKIQSAPQALFPPETDPADPQTLKAYLLDSMKRYPARHFALTMTGHGGGLAGQAVIGDRRISNEALGRVLEEVAAETGQKIDVLNLDTCYGSNLEVLHPLRNAVGYVVASEGPTALVTEPLADTVRAVQASLAQGQEVSPSEVARLFVETSRYQELGNLHTPTLAAVDMGGLGKVSEAVTHLHSLILERKTDPALLCQALDQAAKLHYSSIPRTVFVWDLGSLGHELAALSPDPVVAEAARQMEQSVRAAVLAEEHQTPGKETWATRLLRAPLQTPFADHSGLTGIAMHYDPESRPSGSRLPMLKETELGRQTQVEALFEHLSQVYRDRQAQMSGWERGAQALQQKARLAPSKIARAIGVPFVLPAVTAGLAIAAGVGLSCLGLPVASVALPVAGVLLAARGARVLAEHQAAAGERESFAERQERFEAARTVAEKLEVSASPPPTDGVPLL